MKFNFPQLSAHLSKQLAPLYFISSDEILLVEEARDLIRKKALQEGFLERVSLQSEASTDWEKVLYEETHSLSLFASKRLIELSLGDTKPNAAQSKILEHYANHILPDTLLIVSANKLDSKIEKSAWYKAFDKNGIMMTIWPIPPAQLPSWIKQRAQNIGLTMTLDAANYLAEQVEGNLLAAAQEVEKLGLLYPPGKTTAGEINLQLLEKTVTDHARFTIFDLVDSALAGNSERSLRILATLNADDIEPVLILWSFTRELRTLATLAKQLKQGVSLNSLFSQFRIWEKRQPCVRHFLKHHSQQSCWELLVKTAHLDRLLKGAIPGNIWQELERFILAITHNFTMDTL